MLPRFLMMLTIADPSLGCHQTNHAIALLPSARRPTITCRFPMPVPVSALNEVEQTSVHLVRVRPGDAVRTSFDH